MVAMQETKLHSMQVLLQGVSFAWKETTYQLGHGTPHLRKIFLILAYNAFPSAVLPFTAQKPVMLSSLRAFLTASKYFLKPGDISFLARAELALLTSLPFEFFIKESLVKPLGVFSFLPLNTDA